MSTIRFRSSLTNTPTVDATGQSFAMISDAARGVTYLGLCAQKLKPSASAPASSAASASSMVRIPQTFTLTLAAIETSQLSFADQSFQLVTRVRRAHEMLANQERAKAGRFEPPHIGTVVDAALAHERLSRGCNSPETNRRFKIDF